MYHVSNPHGFEWIFCLFILLQVQTLNAIIEVKRDTLSHMLFLAQCFHDNRQTIEMNN